MSPRSQPRAPQAKLPGTTSPLPSARPCSRCYSHRGMHGCIGVRGTPATTGQMVLASLPATTGQAGKATGTTGSWNNQRLHQLEGSSGAGHCNSHSSCSTTGAFSILNPVGGSRPFQRPFWALEVAKHNTRRTSSHTRTPWAGAPLCCSARAESCCACRARLCPGVWALPQPDDSDSKPPCNRGDLHLPIKTRAPALGRNCNLERS
jgi:hypothetical protein